MENEIALLLSIIFCICFVLFWIFLLTWQQIGFLKKDVARLQEKNEEYREKIRDLEREFNFDKSLKYKGE